MGHDVRSGLDQLQGALEALWRGGGIAVGYKHVWAAMITSSRGPGKR